MAKAQEFDMNSRKVIFCLEPQKVVITHQQVLPELFSHARWREHKGEDSDMIPSPLECVLANGGETQRGN